MDGKRIWYSGRMNAREILMKEERHEFGKQKGHPPIYNYADFFCPRYPSYVNR